MTRYQKLLARRTYLKSLIEGAHGVGDDHVPSGTLFIITNELEQVDAEIQDIERKMPR